MFGRAIKLFTVFGFSVKADASWLIIAALVVWSLAGGVFPVWYQGLGPGTYIAMAVIAAIGLFLSIIVHELCHSLVARRYGLEMKGITLFIFGGVAEMADEPSSAKAEFWMAIAGPASSFAIAAVFYGLTYLDVVVHGPLAVYGVLLWIAYINALLAAFNLIPGFPLDGGRVLRSIIWHFQHNLRRATRAAATVGSIFGLLLIALGIVSLLFEHALAGIWWILIGWFVRSAARQEYQSVLYREMLHGQSVRKVMTANPITVAPNVSLADFVDNYIYRYHFQTFPVVDQGRLLGCVGVSDVQRVPRNQWATRPVNDITASCGDAAAIGPDEDAMHALTKMNNTRSSRLLVVEGDKLVGVVTLKDLMHFLGIRMRLEGAGGPGSGVEDQEDLPSDGDDRAA